MSHAIDLDGLHEKLFILQHLVYGSQGYCVSEGITDEEEAGYTEFQSCWGWTKAIVSNYLIECAVKLRMIQEFCARNCDADELNAMEQNAMGGLVIGRIHEGTFRLTVREACNKIIHATRATIVFGSTDESAGSVQHWDGQYNLTGTQGNHQWSLQLDVASWAKAAAHYLELLETSEKTIYLGQDFA
jgi:hypothetical protein